MVPARAGGTRATISLRPSRPWVVLAVRFWSASMTLMASAGQPHSRARCRRAYWSRRLSWLVRTWWGLDWRMLMRAWRPRWNGVMSSEMLMDGLRVDGRDVVDRLVLQGLREPLPDIPGLRHDASPSVTRERSSWTASRVHFVRGGRAWHVARLVDE